VNLRLTERAAVGIEAHMVRSHATVPGLEHHERRVYADRLSVLRDHAPALSQLYQMLFSGVGVVLRMAVTIGLLLSVQPLLALLCLCAVPPVLVSTWRAGAEKDAEEAGAPDRRRALSIFELGTSPAAAKELRVARVRERLLQLSAASWDARYRPLARARSASAFWLAAAYGVFAVALVTSVGLIADRRDAVGSAILVLVSGSRLSQYLSDTVRELRLFREIWLDCARRLTWLEDFAAAAASTATAGAPERLTDGIRLEHVSFRYAGTGDIVLRDVSLHLPAGAVVAIVGENGAGKSTLVKLLCRYYEPTEGRITVDGVDLSVIAPVAWRSRLTGAFQDFVKFEYTVREAVGVGDVARLDHDTAVATALRRAGATDLVDRLPDGVDTQLGTAWDGGVDLSHGQWQKIALARSFMPDHPLITILDEPTSALDARSEADIFQRYAAAARDGKADGRMTIFVSHRFSTVRMADLIVVLDGARVAEVGSHADLMARAGLYAELYDIQASAYRHDPPVPGTEA
jgi:ATP-binding cassette subfamily B protein